jgi:FkbM family methyltransferase
MPGLKIESLKSALRWRINYFQSISIDSVRVKIPVINGVGRAHLDFVEDHIYLVLKRLSPSHRHLIDVGANIGQTLVKWFAVRGSGCDYIGFDVNAQCASYCEHLISANKLSKAHVFPVGLGSELCLTPLFLASGVTGVDPGASTNSLIRDDSFYSCSRQALIVPASLFSKEICLSSKPIIKIDIEGSEAEVIKPLLAIPGLDSAIFIVEILPPCQSFSSPVNDARIENKRKIFKLMRDAGYQGQNIRCIAEAKDSSIESPDYLFFRTDLPSGIQELLLP